MKTLFTLFVLALVMGCGVRVSGDPDDAQARRIQQQQAQAEKTVPPPRVTRFTMLRDAVRIQEIADEAITTWAYYMDLNGGLHFLCESKGYGLPYSTQTTNPQREERGYNTSIPLPQAEPSGLFMPDNVAATWILCVNDEGEFDAVYWEPDLVVSPFPLNYKTDLRAN